MKLKLIDAGQRIPHLTGSMVVRSDGNRFQDEMVVDRKKYYMRRLKTREEVSQAAQLGELYRAQRRSSYDF